MSNKFLFFSSETTPPAGQLLSDIYLPIETEFNKKFGGKHYGTELDRLAIICVCFAKEWIDNNPINERKYISKKNRYADFRLSLDFERFIKADNDAREKLFVGLVKKAIDVLYLRLPTFSKYEFWNDFSVVIESVKQNEKRKQCVSNTICIDSRFMFIANHCPKYIGGDEVEQSQILSNIYDSISKDISEKERISIFINHVNKTFNIEDDHYPIWAETPEWPVYNGFPMKFISQKRDISNSGDIRTEYVFEDVVTGELRIVEQFT